MRKNGPRVPALGFGLMEMSWQTYGTMPNDEPQFAILDRALELGATFWDTAPRSKTVTNSEVALSANHSSSLYEDSEKLLGRWFQRTRNRDQIILATKFGFVGGLKTDSSALY
ncbi:NADP-dependent oxidoreductase domain-containing protein [Aspergillus multicolor]|uniref:NADP-dependent oxidoreductase domain-containing protein n=1 Tax=Aspergillus multicolor TaxID=41759 RepID=UPI003CCE4CBF